MLQGQRQAHRGRPKRRARSAGVSGVSGPGYSIRYCPGHSTRGRPPFTAIDPSEMSAAETETQVCLATALPPSPGLRRRSEAAVGARPPARQPPPSPPADGAHPAVFARPSASRGTPEGRLSTLPVLAAMQSEARRAAANNTSPPAIVTLNARLSTNRCISAMQ